MMEKMTFPGRRRTLIRLLLGSAGLALTACARQEKTPACSRQMFPEGHSDFTSFSAQNLQSRLEVLRQSFEMRGEHVTRMLQPPIGEEALRRRCKWFPAELPPELIALYGWHGGQEIADEEEENYPFWFRDCIFSTPENAHAEYLNIMETYGVSPDADWVPRSVKQMQSCDHEMLKYAFPFAAFNGGWLVLPCKGQYLDSRFERPVISVFQGIDIHYQSITTMVDTCIEWNAQERTGRYGTLDSETERRIWKKHNPEVFQPSEG